MQRHFKFCVLLLLSLGHAEPTYKLNQMESEHRNTRRLPVTCICLLDGAGHQDEATEQLLLQLLHAQQKKAVRQAK